MSVLLAQVVGAFLGGVGLLLLGWYLGIAFPLIITENGKVKIEYRHGWLQVLCVGVAIWLFFLIPNYLVSDVQDCSTVVNQTMINTTTGVTTYSYAYHCDTFTTNETNHTYYALYVIGLILFILYLVAFSLIWAVMYYKYQKFWKP